MATNHVVVYSAPGIMFLPSLRVNLKEWRKILKAHLLIRDVTCRGCGEKFVSAPHMHEGIISRNDVSGWKLRLKKLIHVEPNCVLLCASCNLGRSGKSPPQRVQVWTEHCEQYGYELMHEWLDSLPFKVPPRFP